MSSRRRPGDAGRPKLLCQTLSSLVRARDGSCSSNSDVELNQSPQRDYLSSSDALPGQRVKMTFSGVLSIYEMAFGSNCASKEGLVKTRVFPKFQSGGPHA